MLLALSQKMDMLRDQNKQTAKILTNIGIMSQLQVPPDEALEKLLDHATSHIANPYIRSGFKKALEITIRQGQEGCEQVQILRQDAGAADKSLAPCLKLVNRSRQWRVLTTRSPRTTKSLFGDITIQTNTYETTPKSEKDCEHISLDTQYKLRIFFRPATWLVRFGLAYEL